MAGEGSICRRERIGSDGKPYTRWIAQVSSGPRTARRYQRRTCRSRADARRALDELRAGRPAPTRLPLGMWLRLWLDETARPSVSANTYRGYEDVLAHLSPIADIPLGALTAEDVEHCLNRMTARRRGQQIASPAAPKTVRNAHVMLRAALGMAQRRGHVARNVARDVPLRRVPRRHVPALTPDVAAAVLRAVQGDRYEPAYALGLLGLRASELLGLVWDDIDAKAGSLRVTYQLVGSGRRARRAQPKSASSERTVYLPASVLVSLADHRTRQREERIAAGKPTTEGHVFLTPRGLPVNGSWLTKHLQGLCEAAGLPKLGLHALRHGAADLMADAGVHPSIAQAVLGHASSVTTLDRYTSTTAAQQREAMDRVFGRVVGK